jgi:hypothetical protein
LQNCRLSPSPADSLHSSTGNSVRKASAAASLAGPYMAPSNCAKGVP